MNDKTWKTKKDKTSMNDKTVWRMNSEDHYE